MYPRICEINGHFCIMEQIIYQYLKMSANSRSLGYGIATSLGSSLVEALSILYIAHMTI